MKKSWNYGTILNTAIPQGFSSTRGMRHIKNRTMKNIAKDYLTNISEFSAKYSQILRDNDVQILTDFLQNEEAIIEFERLYIEPNKPKIVLCGINPGRYGAGKTGIPFIDFNSLSEMLPNVNRKDAEPSAQFFFSVVKKFGIIDFYRSFYVTNISRYGFSRISKQKNVNYYDNTIPTEVTLCLIDKFIREMSVINPNVIIPLSTCVDYELKKQKGTGRITAEIGTRLSHPSWISTYRRKELEAWVDKYVQELIDYQKKYAP